MLITVNMAGTGARVALKAIGKQDTYLEDLDQNFENSFWNYKNIQHTHFTSFFKSRSLYRNSPESSKWPFGETITFNINPKNSGDLLMNCYLKLKLPALPPGKTYCDQIGRAIIKQVTFRVDGTVLQTTPTDWGVIHDEMYLDESDRYGNRFLVNCGEAPDNLPASGVSQKEVPLYIPLTLFFSRTSTILPGNWYSSESSGSETNNADKFRPPFYTCACTNQQIYVEVTLNPITFFTNADDLFIDKIQLVTEEATISPEEVSYYKSNKLSIIYNTSSRQSKYNLDFSNGVKNQQGSTPTGCPNIYKDQLVTNLPAKAFHWFLRDQRYENVSDNTYFLNRFNFSSDPTATAATEYLYEILSDASIYMNGEKQLGLFESGGAPFTNTTGANYYKYVQSFIHGFTVPRRNIYNYSFSLNPREPSPSGSLDFSVMNSSKTFIEGKILNTATSNSYNISTFFIGYMVIEYNNDSCGLLFA